MPHKASLPDEQIALREMYMRLYRSFTDDDQYYPASLVDPAQIKPLLDAGHAVRVAGGYCLTDAGLLHWARLNEKTLHPRIYNKSRTMDPLRKALGIPTLKARPRLSNPQKRLLIQIERLPLNTSGLAKRLMGRVNVLISHNFAILRDGYACVTDEGREEIRLIFRNKEIDIAPDYDPEIVDLSLRCNVKPPVLAVLAKAMPDGELLRSLLTEIQDEKTQIQEAS